MTDNNKETMQEELLNKDNSAELNINADENIAGTAGIEEPVGNNHDDVEKLQAEINEWKDKYTRLFAEFDNFKKRTYREKAEILQTAGKDVIASLLVVLDDCERAEKQLESSTNIDALKEGTLLVFNKLRNILTQKGLKAFESKGQAFDVEKHEAITEIPAPSPELAGMVIDELEKGYLLNEKLIRHAKVVVGKQIEA